MFCDCCNDIVKIVLPCKFIFSDGIILSYDICLDCLKNGTLEINLHRKRLVGELLQKIKQIEE